MVALIIAACLLPVGVGTAAAAADLDLLGLQVFTKQTIQAARSDYEGPVAAGGDIDLHDFMIGGDLTAGGHVAFQRGWVKGFVNAAEPRLSNVHASGAGPVPHLAMELATTKLDLLSARLSAMPGTSRFDVETGVTGGRVFRAVARAPIEVIDLDGSDLAEIDGQQTVVSLQGDSASQLLVRVHGTAVRLRHLGFVLSGGLDPSRVVFFFPEADDLEIYDSGGARDGRGQLLNIPGSIVAPSAAFLFAASTVTGQVFTRSITSRPEIVSGQVNAYQPGSPGAGASQPFVPSTLLRLVASDAYPRPSIPRPNETGSVGCRCICVGQR